MMQWSYDTLLKWGTDELTAHSVDNASVDAWYLLEHIYGISRVDFLIRRNDPFDEVQMKQSADYQALIHRRSEGYPVQYLTGSTEFMGLPFFVNESVLIPRQDTEILAEEALRLLTDKRSPEILDMCTGSGCLLLSILMEKEDAHGTGVDISEGALAVAEKNRKNLHLEERALLVESDTFSGEYFQKNSSEHPMEYDMLISNPPYIPTADIQQLMDEVRLHDPVLALDGKEDGLYFYRRITEEALRYLKPGGWLLYEIGCDQGEAVSRIMRTNDFSNIAVKKDLAGLDRVVLGQKKQEE